MRDWKRFGGGILLLQKMWQTSDKKEEFYKSLQRVVATEKLLIGGDFNLMVI